MGITGSPDHGGRRRPVRRGLARISSGRSSVDLDPARLHRRPWSSGSQSATVQRVDRISSSGWSSWKRSRERSVCGASVKSLFRPARAAVRICYLGEFLLKRIRSSPDPAGWHRSCGTGSITRHSPTFSRGVTSGIPRRPRDRTKVGAHYWTWSWRIANWKTCRRAILVCRLMSYSGIFTRTFPETPIEAKQALTNSGVPPTGTTV